MRFKMKIGMMCLWNAANGPSIHAELVGRAWLKLGHYLRVFSARKHPDARPTFQKDEDFVIKHCSVDEIVKYGDFEDMKAKLIDLFQGKFNLGTVGAFLEDRGAERIAERFVHLFEELMRTRRRSQG